MPLHLWEELAPQVHWYVGGTSAEAADNVVFEGLNGLFSHVLLVVIEMDKFKVHVSVFDFYLVRCRCLFV